MQRGRNAQPVRDAHDRGRAHLIGELHRGRIGGMGQRMGEGDRALIGTFVIGRFPGTDHDRSVDHFIVRPMPILERGEIDERLESRARLPLRLGRSVERTVVVGASADKRAQGSVGHHGNKRPLRGGKLSTVFGETRDKRIFGAALQVKIERCLDDQPLLRLADETGNLRDDIVDVIARARGCETVRDLRPSRSGNEARTMIDEAGLFHRAQHQFRSRKRGVRRGFRIVARRRLDASGQDRRLGERKLVRGLGEETFRRGPETIDARAEIDAVQIQGQDLVLAVSGLQIDSQDRFFHLAPEGAVGLEKQILRELLCQRRSALKERALGDIGIGRPHKTHRIDAEMIAEPAIFHRDERVPDIIGKLAHRHFFP